MASGEQIRAAVPQPADEADQVNIRPDPEALKADATATVAALAGVTKRILRLRFEEDGTHVVVRPLEGELCVPSDVGDIYLNTEHALAIAVFDTDYALFDSFVKQYLSTISTALGGTSLRSNARDTLISVLTVLNDSRVMSLWGKHYPGSVRALRRYWRSRIHPDRFLPLNSDVVGFLHLRAIGCETLPSPLQEAADTAIASVQGKSCPAVLEAARAYLQTAVRHLAKQRSGKDDPGARERLSAALGVLEGSNKVGIPARLGGEVRMSPGDAAQAHALAQQLLSGESVEDSSVGGYDTRLQETHKRLESARPVPLTQQAQISALAQSPVRLVDAPNEPAQDLNEAERSRIFELRAVIVRELGKRRNTLSNTGTLPDPLALVQRRITRSEQDVFQTVEARKGFHALVLCDFSSSMRGARIRAARSAVRILAHALDFPFVDLEVVGYSSSSGIVRLTRFDPLCTELPMDSIRGMTPTHTALEAARLELQHKQGVRRVFLVTDGVPTDETDGVVVGASELTVAVRNAVNKLVRDRIQVSALVIHSTEDHLDFSNKEYFEEMFAGIPWELTDTEGTLDALQALVFRAFLHDLRWSII